MTRLLAWLDTRLLNEGDQNHAGYRLGLFLALAYALVPSAEALTLAFAEPYTVQDDARQFLFWMAQWRDPALFAGDPIAKYFSTVTPPGFKALHYILDIFGLAPFVANKLLVMPLFLATAGLAYRLAWSIRPIAAVAVAASWFTCFFLSLIDQSLLSAVPRAFAVPLFLWFLVALLERRLIQLGLACLMQGIFYPPIALVTAGVLGFSLLRWRGLKAFFSFTKSRISPFIIGMTAIAATLIPYAFATGGYGPVMTGVEAAANPSLQSGGRSAFFLGSAMETYFCGARAGFLPVEWGCGEAYRQDLAIAPILALALMLFAVGVPAALAWQGLRAVDDATSASFYRRAPIFFAVLAAGGFWYFLAHIVLFDLHLPSRYTQHPLRAVAWVAAALLAGPALIAIGKKFAPRLTGLLAIILAGAFFILPLPLGPSPYANYVTGQHPELYRFLSKLRKDVRIASLTLEADNIPSLSARSILSAREYAIPYAKGYMTPLKTKTSAMIRAQYATSASSLLLFLKRYQPHYLLVDSTASDENAIERQWWNKDYPLEAKWAKGQIHQDEPFLF
ncbi:MAG TPA: hypothetical protein DCS82_12270, partial [Rhodospirillaceae bacterium]|nr:hypothetical protein [Rhodospirillaceae bacterium]